MVWTAKVGLNFPSDPTRPLADYDLPPLLIFLEGRGLYPCALPLLKSAEVRRIPIGLDTPNSYIVTPYITSARFIVLLLWVTIINWL